MNKNKSNKKKFILIGIAGCSGSGKTTFCSDLKNELNEYNVNIISTDNFFYKILPKTKSPISNKEYDDWNSPNSIDIKKLLDHIKENIEMINETSLFLVEGISTLYFKELRDLFDLKIFIDLDSDERMYRRIKRNTLMWNLSFDDVATYYLEIAKFRENEFFIPTKIYADIILNGYNLKGNSKDVIINWIKFNLSN